MKVRVEIIKSAIIEVPDSWRTQKSGYDFVAALCAEADKLADDDYEQDGTGYEFYDFNGEKIA